MKKLIFILLQVISVTCAGCRSQYQTSSDHYYENSCPVSSKAMVGDFNLELKEYLSINPVNGQLTTCHIVLSNIGQNPITYGDTDIGEHLSVDLSLTDVAGKTVPLTLKGANQFSNFSPTFVGSSELLPRQSRHWTVDLAESFKVRPSATYCVSADFEVMSQHSGDIAVSGLIFRSSDSVRH